MPYDQAHRPFPYDLGRRVCPSSARRRALDLIRRAMPHVRDTRDSAAPLLNLIDDQVLCIEPVNGTHFVIRTNAPRWDESQREAAITACRQLNTPPPRS